MSEEFSLGGSLKRKRHREDSAYMSQRDSMSGGPPETSSPEMEEEDQNGYVLPGQSPERGDRIIHVFFFLLKLYIQYRILNIYILYIFKRKEKIAKELYFVCTCQRAKQHQERKPIS